MKLVLCIAARCGLTCFVPAQATQSTKNDQMPAFLKQLADTRKTIADGYAQWTEAVKAGNIDALAAMYTNDATILPDGEDAVSGTSAIRTFYSHWLAQPGKLVDEKFENINSVQEGSLLIDSSRYRGVAIRNGKEVAFSGKRLVVWQRQLQGPWKILRDAWNKSSPE